MRRIFHMQFFFITFVMFFLTRASYAENQLKPNDSIMRIPLLTAQLQTKKKIERVEVKQINFSPQQKAGIHLHPAPVVGYIAAGSILFQIEGEEIKILNTGDAFFEPAGAKILHFDNADKKEKATFIAYYLLGKKDQQLIKMLNH